MKWKISTIILTIALVLASCGDSTQSISAANQTAFRMEKIGYDWYSDCELYEDKETHIEYIIVKGQDGLAITPRYIRDDGTLYTRAADE